MITDSRRLTGANLLLPGAGAVIDVQATSDEARDAVATWRRCLDPLLEGVGWSDAIIGARRHREGVTLAFSAPIDALYAATEVNEAAWDAAAAELSGRPGADRDSVIEKLRQLIADERNPRVLALEKAALERSALFLWDDDVVSVGSGTGCTSWPVADIPAPQDIDWSTVHDVPCALVTGTNGKTTTARMLAAILTASGRTVGITSTDGLVVAGESVDSGDYSGPSGARTVLRDRRVEAAVLETARGGLLRRGMSVPRATVGVVTNIAEDHLGEYGIWTLEELTSVKFLVAHNSTRVVLNADDPYCCRGAGDLDAPLAWFTLSPESPHCRDLVGLSAGFAALEDDWLVFVREGTVERICHVDDFPAAFGGAASHNVANALAAAAAASWFDIPVEGIRKGLSSFGQRSEDNPGRMNIFQLGGAQVLVDFAHNPHGLAAVLEAAKQIPAKRRLVILGQAGDRSDSDIRGLAISAWAGRPDRIVLKELDEYRRGRSPGEVTRILADALREAGAPDGIIAVAPDEITAARDALQWARDGDLLLVTAHAFRTQILDLMTRLRDRGWSPGTPLP